jgi:hypothetical protein
VIVPACDRTNIESYQKVLGLMAENAKLRAEVKLMEDEGSKLIGSQMQRAEAAEKALHDVELQVEAMRKALERCAIIGERGVVEIATDALVGTAQKPKCALTEGDLATLDRVVAEVAKDLNLTIPEKRKCDKQYSLEDSYGYCGREIGHDGDHGRNG